MLRALLTDSRILPFYKAGKHNAVYSVEGHMLLALYKAGKQNAVCAVE